MRAAEETFVVAAEVDPLPCALVMPKEMAGNVVRSQATTALGAGYSKLKILDDGYLGLVPDHSVARRMAVLDEASDAR